MPQLSNSVGAISREWMAMTYIMILHLCSIITTNEMLEKKILDIGVISSSVMHSTLLYHNYPRNITHESVTRLIMHHSVVIYETVKQELQKIIDTYLSVVAIILIVTYCSIIETGRSFRTNTQELIKPLVSDQSSVIESGRSPRANNHESGNTYLYVVLYLFIVTYCSMIESGRSFRTITQEVLTLVVGIQYSVIESGQSLRIIDQKLVNTYLYVVCCLLIVTYCSMIESGRSLRTIIQKLFILLVVAQRSMIESGRSFRTIDQQSEYTCLYVVCCLLIVTYCSMIESGRSFRTITHRLFTLFVVIQYSMIESGRSLRIIDQGSECTYLYTVYCLLIVTYCSMIESGRSLRTITHRLFILLGVIQYSVIEPGRSFRITEQESEYTCLYTVYCIFIVTYCSMIESGRSFRTITHGLFTLLAIIQYSMIETGRPSRIINQGSQNTYSYVVYSLFMVTYCSMIESGRSFRTIYQRLSVLLKLVQSSVIESGRLFRTSAGSDSDASTGLRSRIPHGSKYSHAKLKNYKIHALNIYSIASPGKLNTVVVKIYYVDQFANVLIHFVGNSSKYNKFSSFNMIYFNKYEILINYRSWNCRDLQAAASEATYKARERRVKSRDTILVPHIDGVHGSATPSTVGKFPVDKMSVANRIAGYRHNKKWHTDSGHPDTKHMAAFLKNAPDPAVLYDPGLVDFEKLITSKAPILDYLKVYADMQGTWDYPPREEIAQWRLNRGISPQWFQGTTITEYVIGSGDNFQDFVDLFWQNFHADQELLPTGVISLDVEDKKVWKFDLLRICNFRDQVIPLKKSKENLDSLPEHLRLDADGKVHENKETNVPAKIMFGGVHWGMMISLGIRSTSTDEYEYDCKGFPEEVIDFLESLPPIVGAGIKADVKGVESFVSQVTGREMRFKAFIELGVLATMCGWQLQRRGMFILSLITLGSTMNKLVSCADGQWGIPFHELDPAMQCYAIGDTKMGHITYGVLVTAFLHQVAPDPDMACRLSKCTQIEWVTWFCTLIRESLMGLEISQQAAESHSALHGSYQELVDIIRYRDIHGKVSAGPPECVKFIAGLVRWPSIAAGGPRYLHAVRLHHLSVHEAIRESSGLPGTKQYFSHKVDTTDRMYATFGHKDVLSLDLSKRIEDPELSDFQFSLEVHPDLAKPALFMEFPLDVTYIHSRSTKLDRGVREALLEWFRLDISRVDQFHQNCNDNRELAVAMRGRYEDIRLMYFGLMNREPVAVVETEESITEEVQAAIAKQRAFKQELLAAVQQQDDILHELYLADSGVIYQDRYAWKKKPLPRVIVDPSRPVLDSTGAVLGSAPASRSGCSFYNGNRVGRQLTDRLDELDVVEPSLGLFPVTSMRMPDQCLDGGRSTGKGKGKGKSSWPSGDTNRRVMTQDEVEEEVRVVRHVGDEFELVLADMEEFMNDLPSSPDIAIVLED